MSKNLSLQRHGRPVVTLARVVTGITIASVMIAGCDSSSHPASAVPTAPTAVNASVAEASPGVSGSSSATTSAKGGRAAATGVIYVTSQGLYFDTFVAKDPLPMHGPFQLLRDTNGDGVGDTTEFGPGNPGYVGGRWWEDLNANSVQDEGDHFFLCPLLPPGRPTP